MRLRYRSKQFDASGHDVLLDVEDNVRKTTYIDIAKNRNPGHPVPKGQEKQCRTESGSHVKRDRISHTGFMPTIPR